MAMTRGTTGEQGHAASRRNPKRATRAESTSLPTRSKRMYAEDSTESDDDSDVNSTDNPDANPSASDAESQDSRDSEPPYRSNASSRPTLPGKKRVRSSRSSRSHKTKAHRQSPQGAGRSVMRRSGGLVASAGKRRRDAPRNSEPLPSVGPKSNVPNWLDSRIPFQCWADVFLYASREGSADVLNRGWLVNAATTCKALAEPALTAIYRSPTIITSAKAKRLVALLERPVTETSYNYRVKIESLHVNVQIVPLAILFQLIHPLNRLKELIVYTTMDQPPYRDLDKTLRWHYPEEIFRALEAPAQDEDVSMWKQFTVALESWEWSGRFLGGFVPSIDAITRLHKLPQLTHLTQLSMTNFQVPSLKDLQGKVVTEEKELEAYLADGLVIQAVARAISELRSLEHLIFESSTVVNDRLLPLLPKHLAHFEMINCWEVRSEDLARFLRTHGAGLRALKLLHNQSLDLGFLTDLDETCPDLRELDINLSYYRHHDSINDADPMYENVLLPHQIPKWPSSLRVINIEHIRDWSVETAEMFLNSIVQSAPHLPNLRILSIKTMLDIPWQARATMRREWRDKMERVFIRRSKPPRYQPSLQSEIEEEGPIPKKRRRNETSTSPSPSRRSNRIATASQQSHSPSQPAASSRRDRGSRPVYAEPDTDEDEFDQPDEDTDPSESGSGEGASSLVGGPAKEGTGQEFIQGLCTTVNILFDNQKVRELQYSMADFASEESESEEEWNGDYEEDEHVFQF